MFSRSWNISCRQPATLAYGTLPDVVVAEGCVNRTASRRDG